MSRHPEYEPLTVAARPELTGGRRIGVLLSHGFTGSPASMRPWGRHLGDLGYGVRIPLLPGHATSWEDLNTRTWNDWYGELTRAFDELVAEHDAVVVGGLSMGGALALRLTADRGDDISGVMVVNPAVATKRLDVKALPVLKHLVASLPGIANDIKKEGVEEHGYTRTPLRAIHSLIQAWRPLIADLPQVKAPLVYFRSANDHVVDEASEPIILGRISSTDVEVVRLPDSYHVATLDNDAATIFERSAEFIARVTAS
ncbi:alpha/beta hydrolase [Nocardioides antri]|uniref:Alpha/beta fold hydrolase n=1 Tax=Nocardioides antri TaxID=2607659 RepID=A0A5B1MAC2_9ACTN|nr:alpha/beta fold hydrolase [Nocardioides antri]KAA1428959.1 alpha/beta fold hydrolase [Nocardioides antri]